MIPNSCSSVFSSVDSKELESTYLPKSFSPGCRSSSLSSFWEVHLKGFTSHVNDCHLYPLLLSFGGAWSNPKRSGAWGSTSIHAPSRAAVGLISLPGTGEELKSMLNERAPPALFLSTSVPSFSFDLNISLSSPVTCSLPVLID